MPKNLLLVDDDQWLLESLAAWLSEQDFRVTPASSLRQAKQVLAADEFDICLVDVCMEGDQDGFDFLKFSRKNFPDVPVCLMTGYGGPDAAVEAIEEGAFDLLTKPIIDQELLSSLNRAIEKQAVEAENKQLKAQLENKTGLSQILSHDARMLKIFDVIDSVADTKATILITGENGTGKSMIARAIHQRSERAKQAFVEVACGALPDNLLESELFGHVEGAFTGASGNKVGKFAHADGGTIFLDEIGTASTALQIKLLRVLQEFQFEPIGDNQTVTVDTRCVLATNEDLEQAVQEGKFRQDLFYRINVIHLELPALRDRVSDIPLLVEHFLQKSLKDVRKEIDGFSADAIEAMLGYAWPGNIRELENVVQRAVLLTKTPEIGVEMLPPSLLSGMSGASAYPRIARDQTLREALEGPERQIILDVLKANAFSRNLTANQLGINRTTLYKKMKRLGIDGYRFQD